MQAWKTKIKYVLIHFLFLAINSGLKNNNQILVHFLANERRSASNHLLIWIPAFSIWKLHRHDTINYFWVKFPEFEPKERREFKRPTEFYLVASRNLVSARYHSKNRQIDYHTCFKHWNTRLTPYSNLNCNLFCVRLKPWFQFDLAMIIIDCLYWGKQQYDLCSSSDYINNSCWI